MGFLDPLFDTTLGPLLGLPPLVSIFIISFLISLFIVLVYKWLTDQKEMKRLKDELSEHQKKMRSLKSEPEKMLAVQKEAMSLNMKYMKKSFRPTLFTMIPILLIFGWLNGHFAFEPLLPNQAFDVLVEAQEGVSGNVTAEIPEEFELISDKTTAFEDGKARFSMKGPPGEYVITFASGEREVSKSVLITDKRAYLPPVQIYKSEVFKSVNVLNEKLTVIGNFGWIWAYIAFALVTSIVLRKLLKIY